MWELLEDEYQLKPGVAELSDGTEGMTWPDGRVHVNEATYRGMLAGNGRARFTMCHEAYHGLAHREQIRNVLVDTGELVLYRRSQLAPTVDPEWQANVFAASILMPWSTVQQVLREASDKPIEDMMYYFKVSNSAAAIRYRESKRRFGNEPALSRCLKVPVLDRQVNQERLHQLEIIMKKPHRSST